MVRVGPQTSSSSLEATSRIAATECIKGSATNDDGDYKTDFVFLLIFFIMLAFPLAIGLWHWRRSTSSSTPEKGNLVKGSKDLESFGDNLLHHILRWLLPERSKKSSKFSKNGSKRSKIDFQKHIEILHLFSRPRTPKNVKTQ